MIIIFKFIRNIVLFILIFFLGYFTSTTGILEDTEVGRTLDNAVYSILNFHTPEEEPGDENNSSNSDSGSSVSSSILNSVSEPDPSVDSSEATLPREADGQMDLTLVEEEIFTHVNNLRIEQDLHPLQEDNTLKQAAKQRAIEASVSFSHTRPSGQSTFTILKEDDFYYPYSSAGENLGMATAFGDEQAMARILFTGWVDSEDHYAAMIHPDFNELGVGAYMSDDIVYAVQLFGTRRY